MVPVIISLDIHLTNDIPILQRSDSNLQLLSHCIFLLIMTTTIAHYTDIVNIRHQITIRIINGTHRTRTTQNMIIEIIIHISRTLIISTYPTVRVIYLQCLSQLGTDFSCNSIAVIIFCSITHETFLRHIVSRKIISHLITTTTHADVMFL